MLSEILVSAPKAEKMPLIRTGIVIDGPLGEGERNRLFGRISERSEKWVTS